MDNILPLLPFLLAISLLVVGVLRSKRVLFFAAFPVLLFACFYTLVSEGSSGAFNSMGIFFMFFGFACGVLSNYVPVNGFASKAALRSIGALFVVLGFAGAMIA